VNACTLVRVSSAGVPVSAHQRRNPSTPSVYVAMVAGDLRSPVSDSFQDAGGQPATMWTCSYVDTKRCTLELCSIYPVKSLVVPSL
jgi:hypothetical protein